MSCTFNHISTDDSKKEKKNLQDKQWKMECMHVWTQLELSLSRLKLRVVM